MLKSITFVHIIVASVVGIVAYGAHYLWFSEQIIENVAPNSNLLQRYSHWTLSCTKTKAMDNETCAARLRAHNFYPDIGRGRADIWTHNVIHLSLRCDRSVWVSVPLFEDKMNPVVPSLWYLDFYHDVKAETSHEEMTDFDKFAGWTMKKQMHVMWDNNPLHDATFIPQVTLVGSGHGFAFPDNYPLIDKMLQHKTMQLLLPPRPESPILGDFQTLTDGGEKNIREFVFFTHHTEQALTDLDHECKQADKRNAFWRKWRTRFGMHTFEKPS